MNINQLRRYRSSSSYKMAVLFTLLLGLALLVIAIMMVKNFSLLENHKELLIVLILSMVLMLVVICVSFFISIYVVMRINHIATIAQRIMSTGDLSQRITVSTRWDDLSDLAFVLNELFAKVDHLMMGIRQVTDNVAHDLRTPLTRMRNQLTELSIKLNKNNSEDTAIVEKIITETDRLLETFTALLRISNIENGKRAVELENNNIANIIDDVVQLYQPMFEEKNIELSIELENYTLALDKHLIFQAFANLLDNAMKFTPRNGNVCITMAVNKGALIITISDTGKGIQQAHRDKVFERFYREDTSRTTSGNGLGLALVKAIINMHHGVIALEDNQPCGLIVKVIFYCQH